MFTPSNKSNFEQTNNEMKELKEKFEGTGEVKGVQFTQIAKSDKAYIYERDDEGGKIV